MSILATVAGDRDTEHVLAIGRDMAASFDVPLEVLHVSRDRTSTVDDETERGSDEADGARNVTQSAISQYLDKSIDATALGRVGEPAEVILEVIADRDPRYLVIGATDRSPTGKALLGSTAQSVLLGSPISTVAVPLHQSNRLQRNGPVIAAVDRSERASTVVREANRVAEAFNRQLHVVHVLSAEDFYDVEYASLLESGHPVSMDELRSIATEIAAEAVEHEALEYEPRGLVGKPSARILKYSQERDSSYIVTSGRNRSPIGKALFGSVTQSILRDATVPVLTARSAESDR